MGCTPQLAVTVALYAALTTPGNDVVVTVVVGVPEMTPVAAFKVKPAGSVPALMLQV
jgi:hypothetical protein